MTAAKAGQSLTGVWDGRYFYPRSLPPMSFVATLIETATMLAGTTHEPAGMAVRYATLQGRRAGSSVAFVKTYDDTGETGERPHPIDYRGVLNGDATEIEGVWHIPGHWSGRFLMIRSPGKTIAASREIAEQV